MEKLKLRAVFIVLSTLVIQNLGAPADSTNSLVVAASETSRTRRSTKEGITQEDPQTLPQIYQMHVNSKISNRFAHTTVTSKVKNFAEQAQEVTFSIILPETAFISAFVMEIDGKNYTAYVQEKEEAKNTYDRAVASGQGAAHVAVNARDSNRFSVSVNVESQTKAAFYLSYEELLKRDNGHYELVINLHPGQPIKDLNVEVAIIESRKITNLKAPPMRSGNEIGSNNAELDPRADIQIINDTSAVIRFTPNLERQKQLAHLLDTEESSGLAGQFIIQYDVERDPTGGEVLIQDGYFVHFFAPSELTPLPKYVIFVLDTSSSMYNEKIAQLKEAMHKILEQLHDKDAFSLVEFNSNVKVWNLNSPSSSVLYPNTYGNYYPWNEPADSTGLSNYTFPGAYSANPDNINKAKDTISKFIANGGTDIHSALKIGLHLVKTEKKQSNNTNNRQPLIIFLTDGEPTVRMTSLENILNTVSEYNSGVRKAPIFALSFGNGADKNFLQKLALRNSGFSKHIYEASDASLQLQDFYRQISSPLLANVTFKYQSSVASLTKTDFPIYFDGSELVVAGRYGNIDITANEYPTVDSWNGHEYLRLRPSVEEFVSSIERLWGYLTVKQYLVQKETSDEDLKELKKKALNLALKYSFVTPVSSLVVVKPNVINTVDTETAEKQLRTYMPQNSGRNRISNRLLVSQHSNVYSDGTNSRIPYTVSRASAVSDLRFGEDDIPSFRTAPYQPTSAIVKTNLLNKLPWLSSILNANGTLTLPKGTYKLGLDKSLSDIIRCSNTPLNGDGHCTLLGACPQVHSFLTSLDVYVRYFCDLKHEYAGVCCPDHS